MKKIIMNMIEDGCTLILGVDNTEVEVSKRNIIKSDEEKYNQLKDVLPFVQEDYENGKIDEREVAYYYLKADEHALLSRWEARWLLNYHEDVGIPGLTDEDVERLQAFARYPDEIDEAIVDSTYVDSIQ